MSHPGLTFAVSLALVLPLASAGQVQKIEWNVVKLGGKDRANVNVLVALDTLREGKVVGLPTDTVYGFVADATRPRPIQRLYNISGWQYFYQPITIALDEIQQVSIYADIDHLDRSMLSQLLPGRVTVVLRRRIGVLPHLNPSTDLIPIRVPGKKEKIFIRKLTHQLERPLALVGARKVGRPHSICIDDFEDIRLRAYVVYDGGKMERKKMEGTTVVDLTTSGRYKILWPGCVFSAVVSIMERYGLEEWTDGPNITVFNPT
ncbi:yrdC domain-containing protein, mitochondrial-like [Homalodisca vitripennis]|uniref:yrdC domain-containing protein, mitochondrial-like n=1 Tax=Homalodisca vitripennis TaxID=197043 RepID=UPI001EEB1C71|nr:yrdC domain-containing protein, mitochondrial-like [Homalodisca vitripennis]